MDEQRRTLTSPTRPIPGREQQETSTMGFALQIDHAAEAGYAVPPRNAPFRYRGDTHRKDVKFHFSFHALARLEERCKLGHEEVLAMLEEGACCRLARRIKWEFLLERHPECNGLSLEEIRSRGVNTLKYTYSHLLIWSEPDQAAFTLIVRLWDRRVITVLYSDDQEGRHSWSDKVTPEVLERAKEHQAEFKIPKELRGRVYARASWVTSENYPRGKNLAGASFGRFELPLEESVVQGLVEKTLELAAGGRDIKLQLVGKERLDKHGKRAAASYLVTEFEIHRGPDGTLEVVEAEEEN